MSLSEARASVLHSLRGCKHVMCTVAVCGPTGGTCFGAAVKCSWNVHTQRKDWFVSMIGACRIVQDSSLRHRDGQVWDSKCGVSLELRECHLGMKREDRCCGMMNKNKLPSCHNGGPPAPCLAFSDASTVEVRLRSGTSHPGPGAGGHPRNYVSALVSAETA